MFSLGTVSSTTAGIDWTTIYTYVTTSVVTITDWIGESISTAPTIPNSIDGKIVVVNSDSTFLNKASLVSCRIGPSVKFNYIFMGSTIPNSMSGAFSGCGNLLGVDMIPSGVTSMFATFDSCTGLISAPAIPNSVTNMYGTFFGCMALINAPTLGSGVIDMTLAFRRCVELITAPTIPDSVTSLYGTFGDCPKLINAPIIGAGVVDMTSTFRRCYALVGTITIVNPNVIDFTDCFTGCTESLAKTLRCPAGSASYTLAMSTCNGLDGVTVIEY